MLTTANWGKIWHLFEQRSAGRRLSTIAMEPMLGGFKQKLFRALRRVDGEIVPSQIRLEASSFCQLRCPSCPTTAGLISPAIGSGFLRYDDFRRLLDRNPTLACVELSNYGEVFLNPQLLEIIEYAYLKGVTIAIDNGANLNHAKEHVLRGLVKYGVKSMTCSIDGASPETYRRYRLGGDFDTVINNIHKINSYKRHYRSELPHLAWQFIVFGHNEHEIETARQMSIDLGMSFHPKLTWDSKFSPIRDAALVRKQTSYQAVTREEHEALYGKKYLSGICHQLWDSPQINWNGKVLGCCRNFWGDFGANAFTDGLSESINSERMRYAREMLMGRKRPREDIPCTTCEMFQDMQKRRTYIRRKGAAAAMLDRYWNGAARRCRRAIRALSSSARVSACQ